MQPHLSVLCPTRKRLPKLIRMMRSIIDTVQNPEQIEFVLRLHSDDAETIAGVKDLPSESPIQVIIGEPLGYKGDPIYYWEMYQVARGDWLFGMNDDVVVKAPKGWDSFLKELSPSLDRIIAPGEHWLNTSRYLKDAGCPFKIVPRGWLARVGIEGPLTIDHHPTDRIPDKCGWRVQFMKNVEVHHLREKDQLMRDEGRG